MTQKGNYVIYWENEKRGFVSYGNGVGIFKDEYHPVGFQNASRYKTKSQAEKTMMWYNNRGGFGFFIVMQVRH